jgi:hypothetical protein
MTPLRSFLIFAVAWLPTSRAIAQDDIRAEKVNRLDLAVRQPDEQSVTDKTRFVSMEIYDHRAGRQRFYVGAGGQQLAARQLAPDGKPSDAKQTEAKWLHRLTLPVRTSDEVDVTEKTRRLGVEVYRELATGNLIYVSDAGAFAVVTPRNPPVDVKEHKPRWLERLPARVRRSGAASFRELLRCNFELYFDESTRCLIVAGENGALALLASGRSRARKLPEPLEWTHALDLKARLPTAKNFDVKTPTFGVEVYEIVGRNAWLYHTESLHVAGVPGEAPDELIQPKAPLWTGRVQPLGKNAAWSIESFHNPNSDHRLLITSKGALAVLPVK